MKQESWKYYDSTLESVQSALVELVTICASEKTSDHARYEIVELLLVKTQLKTWSATV
jgi:hypothetical protein